MKQDLLNIVSEAQSPMHGLNLAKEYLQSRILGIMQEMGAMMPLAFCGGTALRFLYGLNRFSENLDFSLVNKDASFTLTDSTKKIMRILAGEGYTIQTKPRESATSVQAVMLKFPELPFELGLSGRKTQKFVIRLEVDINPPAGAGTEISIIRKFQLLRLQHLDKSSLLAGKIHAVLMRGHTKGRDFYDLAWYLGNREWPEVNMTMLKNALKQSGWTQERINSMNLYKELENRFDDLDWEFVRRDLQPFIEKPAELSILNRNDMTILLKNLT